MGVPVLDPGKKDPGLTEKNSARLLIFFRLLFSAESSGPNETPAAKFQRTRKPRVWFSVSGHATTRR